jgi:hypothetical protein
MVGLAVRFRLRRGADHPAHRLATGGTRGPIGIRHYARLTDPSPRVNDMRQLAVEWGAWDPTEPKGANRVFDRLHSVAKALSATNEGRAAISSLLDDEDASVRMSAATYSLRWNEDAARWVLEGIRDTDPSLRAVTAKYTLREWDAGRLTLDH